ncbi:MAG: outer membrane beta-barrel domain-containing protein [Oligoflexia bacterium]|nr:outer membrane beta-barrel domain-containing protein [Oligoflexia bacterium]
MLKHLLIYATILCIGSPLLAQNQNVSPKVIAIQKRNYHLGTELALNLSYMPMDSFTNYFTIGASVTHYFSDYLGWEIINAGYANGTSTGLREYIVNNFNLEPTDYDVMEYYYTTNIVYTPFYTKNLVFGDKINYGDMSFVLGGGISKYTRLNNVNTIDTGILLRYAFNKYFSTRLDIRYFIYLNGDLKSNLAIALGLAYNFGTDSDSVAENVDE